MMPRLELSRMGSLADGLSLLGKGLQWWRDELLHVLPQRLRRHVYRPLSRLVLVPADDGSHFVCRGPAARLVDANGRAVADGVDARSRVARRARLVASSPRVETVLGLPPEQVLRTVVSYPSAAASDLQDILRHDIDRHTPFAAGEVWFDYLQGEGMSAGNGIDVELLAAPCSQVEPLLEQIEGEFGGLDAVDVLGHADGEDGGTLGVNLLPPPRRRRRHSPAARAALVLVLVLAGLAWTAARQSISAQEQLLAELRHQVEQKRETAQATAALRARLDTAIDELTELVQRRQQQPRALEVLAELTRALPDDTWLEQMSLEGARVDLLGQSASSTSVVRSLEESAMFSGVEFRSQVVFDNRSGQERFRLQADVVTPPGDDS